MSGNEIGVGQQNKSRQHFMQLEEESIKAFKEIYRKEFGQEISDQEALELAQSLLNLFRAIYKPIPFEKKEEFEKLRQSKYLQSSRDKV